MTILLDTGPIVAFFDSSDHYHTVCLDTLRGIEVPLTTSWPVLTEAFYLLGFSWRAQDNLWEFIIRGGVEIVSLNEEMMIRCRYLMKKYADLPMDLADGAMVVIGEKKKAGTIFTLDHRDFGIYHPSHRKRYKLIPDMI